MDVSCRFRDTTLTLLREEVPRNWRLYGDEVTDNYRIISPTDFRSSLARKSAWSNACRLVPIPVLIMHDQVDQHPVQSYLVSLTNEATHAPFRHALRS